MGKRFDSIKRFFTPAARGRFSNYNIIDRQVMQGFGYGGMVGRDEALSVPAVLRGRNMICNISTLPLMTYAQNNVEIRNPFLEQINPNVANSVTIAQTVEDLLFRGVSWWRVTERMSDGFPRYAYHVDVDKVSLNPPDTGSLPTHLPSDLYGDVGVVWVDGEPVFWTEVIRFDSPNPALLEKAWKPIKRLLRIQESAENYAENPRPLDYFTPTNNNNGDPADEMVDQLLKDWRRARKTGSTAYVPSALSYNVVDSLSPADLQLNELIKQCVLDIANAIGVDPEDLGVSTTSRTYQNGVDRRQDRINDVLSAYMRAITDRLSMDDVSKHGHKVRFNLDDYLRADPMTRVNYYEKMVAMGAMTPEEVRTLEGMPNMPNQVVRDPRRVISQIGKPVVDGVQADQKAIATFSDNTAYQFGFTSTVSADETSRVVEGIIVPFNEKARYGGQWFSFLPDSLEWSDLKRVKLLRDHDNAQAGGYALNIWQTAEGYMGRFKVAPGALGDEILAQAHHGTKDGFSIGVDFSTDDFTRVSGVNVVKRATLRETSVTAMPAFDNSRMTSVLMARKGAVMECNICGVVHGENQTACDPNDRLNKLTAGFSNMTTTLEKIGQFLENQPQTNEPDPTPEPAPRPAVVNPTGKGSPSSASFVSEPLPYRFNRAGEMLGGDGRSNDFSTDLIFCARSGDQYMKSEAGRRLKAMFATVTTDINELNPTVNRQDMYVDQRDYRYPLWDAVKKGSTPNGVQPFMFPKYNTSSGLISDHTEGVEPTPGAFTTTSQTVQPTALSGKMSITREVWDMGGNPAISTLLWNQMLRSWREGLENATATFLNTLTAAADINLGAGVVDDQLADTWDAALADLQFIRNYDFEFFALEKNLYKAFVAAEDDTGRPLFPILNPMNANGTATTRFRALNLSGVTGVPAWALTATAGSPNNSWLFDPAVIHGWATAPQKIEAFGTDASGNYAPVAMIDLGAFGYKAFACSDIGGVRQVIYDTTA